MAALGSSTASAQTPQVNAGGAGSTDATVGTDEPVMFCIHDAERGEVSILHGTTEVIVRDRQLVSRILTAASSSARA